MFDFRPWSTRPSRSPAVRALLVCAVLGVACGDDGTAPASRHTLHVAGAGLGSGTLSSDVGGLACTVSNGVASGTCLAQYDDGVTVLLTAAATGTSTFTGWSGACAGATPTCSVTLEQAQNATAEFTAPARAVTIAPAGSGTGTVTSAPAGLTCTGTAGVASGACTAEFGDGSTVTLTAVAAAGSSFTSWSGGCTGTTATCTLTLAAAVNATATFTAAQGLTVAGAGAGGGTVTSSVAGIACSIGAGVATGDCNEVYGGPVTVTLTAVPAAGSTFGGWSGACTGPTCSVVMSQPRAVTATFNGATSGSQSTVTAAPASFTAGAGSSTITVTVKSAAGVPLAGQAVTLAVAAGAPMTITQPVGTTNASGVVTGSVTSTEAGVRTISAQAGATAISQQATVTVQPAAATTLAAAVAFPSTGARFGQALATLPAVVVRDAFANPVPGVTVTYTLTRGLGTIGNGATTSGASVPVVTDATGVARLSSWALASVAAAGNYSTVIDVNNTVTASVAGLAGSPATFTTSVGVSYAADVQSIWDRATPGTSPSCASLGCHVSGGSAPNLQAGVSRASLLASAGLIVPGDSTTITAAQNRLIYRMTTTPGHMPSGGAMLPANMVGIVKAYIRQGAPNN